MFVCLYTQHTKFDMHYCKRQQYKLCCIYIHHEWGSWGIEVPYTHKHLYICIYVYICMYNARAHFSFFVLLCWSMFIYYIYLLRCLISIHVHIQDKSNKKSLHIIFKHIINIVHENIHICIPLLYIYTLVYV